MTLAFVFRFIGVRTKLDTKAIVYGGLCVAIAFVLSYIRLYRWPQGGSITLASALPVFIYAYIFGPTAGIAAGTAMDFYSLFKTLIFCTPFKCF